MIRTDEYNEIFDVKCTLYPELGEKARNNGRVVYSLDFDVTPHQLRHTSATLLITNNVDPRSVSGRLGHAQTSTTLNIYAHALREADRRSADTLEKLLTKHA